MSPSSRSWIRLSSAERLAAGAGERELFLLPVGGDAQEDRDHGGDRRRRESQAAQPTEESARFNDDILADRRG